MKAPELFVGITSWNSALLLGHCVRAAIATTRQMDARIVVLDNGSTDGSAELARELGAEVATTQCRQADALNRLMAMSRSPFTLLMHSDTILLSDKWFPICRSRLNATTALVSPEDVGCGPYSRPFGINQPESSFLFFDTDMARRTRITTWVRKWGIPWPRHAIDFDGPHITHRLPQRLQARGYAWQPMKVHVSDAVAEPIYTPPFKPGVWTEELGHLRYGLGNFYSLDGEITHYHNWYDRVARDIPPDSHQTTERDGKGFPLAYVKRYTENFLHDLSHGCLVLPDPTAPMRQPRAL